MAAPQKNKRRLVLRGIIFIAGGIASLVGIGVVAAWSKTSADTIVSVAGSAAGALAAVWAGQWLSDYRGENSKRELAGILSSIVFKLRAEAEYLSMVHMPEHSSMDRDIEFVLRRMEVRREQLARFRPYRELGDLELIEQVSDLDAYCESITVALRSPPLART